MADRMERNVAGYLANVFLFTLAILTYRYDFYYADFLRDETQAVLLWGYVLYLIGGLPIALLSNRSEEGKGLLALRTIFRFLTELPAALKRYPLDRSVLPSTDHKEKRAILFLLVKFFFLPVMINFLFGNWTDLTHAWRNMNTSAGLHELLVNGWYALLIPLIFFIDTLYFTFGYAVEHSRLRNTVRSVEPTLFGWMVALLCYPPFNDVPGFYVGWAANDYAAFDSLTLTTVLRIAVLLCLGIYLWATIALGAKSSNLTNRGIVDRGPYAYVRHPAYIGKNIAWWLTAIPFMISTGRILFAIASMSVWTLIYFLRAMTEERHLIVDPDYQAYCRKVKWRFIPFVF